MVRGAGRWGWAVVGLVLLSWDMRQSLWNQENRFTGWMDVPLAQQGVQDAKRAASLLRDIGFTFDVAFTSVLQRAIKTMHVILEDLGVSWIPTHCRWRLNERHDGELTGLNKKMAVQQYGEASIKKWRRGYADTPPPLNHSHPCWPGHDSKYAHMGFKVDDLPVTESLKDTLDRIMPCWDEIAALLREGKNVLVVTHGNVVRALAKMLDLLSDQVIVDIDIPSCCPMMYRFRCADLIPVMTPQSWVPLSAEFGGDQDEVRQMMDKVKAETKTQMWARDVRQLLKRNNWAGPEEPTEVEKLWRPLGTVSIGTHLMRTKLRPWSWMKGARGRPAKTPTGHNRLPVRASTGGHLDAAAGRSGSSAGGRNGLPRHGSDASLHESDSKWDAVTPLRGHSRGHSCDAGDEARRGPSRGSPEKRGHDRLPVKAHGAPHAPTPQQLQVERKALDAMSSPDWLP